MPPSIGKDEGMQRCFQEVPTRAEVCHINIFQFWNFRGFAINDCIYGTPPSWYLYFTEKNVPKLKYFWFWRANLKKIHQPIYVSPNRLFRRDFRMVLQFFFQIFEFSDLFFSIFYSFFQKKVGNYFLDPPTHWLGGVLGLVPSMKTITKYCIGVVHADNKMVIFPTKIAIV